MSKSKILGNIASLGTLQLVNYVFPFLTFPYITRIFSTDTYGLALTIVAFSTYLNLITDFGFGLSATRDIAQHIDNKKQLRNIFSNVIAAKILLYLISLIALAGFIFISAQYKPHGVLFLMGFSGVVGNIITPLWAFQGLNKVVLITRISLIGRGLNLVCLFLFVHSNSDIGVYISLNSLVSLLIGFFALYLAAKDLDLWFTRQINLASIWETIVKSFNSFLIVAIISLYTTLNTLFLSWFCDYKTVAIYGVADKILGMVLGVQGMFIQSTFPFLVKKDSSHNQLLKFLKYNVILGIIMCLFMVFGAKYIIHVLVGHKYDQSIKLLMILAITPLTMAVTTFNQTYLFKHGLEKYQTYVYSISGTYVVISNYVTIRSYGYYAVITNFLICEFINIILLSLLIKYKVNVKKDYQI